MSKRRTRKQKEEARHNFTITWRPNQSKINPNVNRQLKSHEVLSQNKAVSVNSADYSGNNENLASIRKDIAKSLILASFILASEMVLYLVWRI